jgi:hypothetical protein
LGKYQSHDDPITKIQPDATYRILGPASHPVYENQRVLQFIDHLKAASERNEDALIAAGECMFASHDSYRDNCLLSVPEVDFIVDAVRTRGPQEGLYGAKITGGGSGGTVEVGALTLLHNFQDFQVVRTVKGRVGPDAGQSLFTPDAQMHDGLLTLRIKADVPRDRSIWFNAAKTGVGLPGPLPVAARPSSPTLEPLPFSITSPGADGYIRDWVVIGPIPYKGDTTEGVLGRDDLDRESSIKPFPGQNVAIRCEALRWTVAHSDEPCLDLNRAFHPTEWHPVADSFGYMVAYIVADRDIPNLTLRLDHDDAVRLWLNGREVRYAREGFDPGVGERILSQHSSASGLTLEKGENVLALKVCNEKGRWAVGLRFKDAEGRPVRDFRVATIAPARP